MKVHNQLENFKYLVESYDGKLTIADRDLISIILGLRPRSRRQRL